MEPSTETEEATAFALVASKSVGFRTPGVEFPMRLGARSVGLDYGSARVTSNRPDSIIIERKRNFRNLNRKTSKLNVK